jgi:two-component system cell cycle sensor histidine kinase/response regulator CckA
MAKKPTYGELDQMVKKLKKEVDKYKRAVEKLHTNENNSNIALHSIGDAVVEIDINGHVAMMNPAAEKLTGWNFSEVKGRSLNEVVMIINEETRSMMESPVERVLREGVIIGPADHSILISRDGTEFPINHRSVPIRNDRGDITGAVLIFRDVIEIRKLEARLKQAQGIQDLGTPANGIVHDLNNNLQSIFSYTQLLLLEKQSDEPDFEKLKEIEKAAQKASEIIHQLLALNH